MEIYLLELNNNIISPISFNFNLLLLDLKLNNKIHKPLDIILYTII